MRMLRLHARVCKRKVTAIWASPAAWNPPCGPPRLAAPCSVATRALAEPAASAAMEVGDMFLPAVETCWFECSYQVVWIFILKHVLRISLPLTTEPLAAMTVMLRNFSARESDFKPWSAQSDTCSKLTPNAKPTANSIIFSAWSAEVSWLLGLGAMGALPLAVLLCSSWGVLVLLRPAMPPTPSSRSRVRSWSSAILSTIRVMNMECFTSQQTVDHGCGVTL